MNELVILTADGTMKAVFQTFFKRQFHLSISCADFPFNPNNDIFNDPLHTDGGVHRRAHELLRPYLLTHRRAIVILDQQFGAELSADEVRVDIENNLTQTGWNEGSIAVVVIDPELEVLLWQDNTNVEAALRHREGSLRNHLVSTGEWPLDANKPISPKETIQKLIRTNRAGPPVAVYSKIAQTVSVARCTDPAFNLLRSTLQTWFPLESA